MRKTNRALTTIAITSGVVAIVGIGAPSATANSRKLRPTWSTVVTTTVAPTTNPPAPAPPTTKAPVFSGTFDNAAKLPNCTVPVFTPGQTNWLDFAQAALAAGCRVHFNQVNSFPTVGSVSGFSAYLGPEGPDGYLPSAYTSSVAAGAVLPGGTLLIGGVNGINIYKQKW